MSLTSSCSVLNCANASTLNHIDKKVEFFPFPKESKTLLKWILFTGRGHNWRPSENHVVCSEHFQDSAFIKNKEMPSKGMLLKLNAIPTIVTLDTCNDDVEYVMEEDSDEEQSKDEEYSDSSCDVRRDEQTKKKSIQTDSRKRRNEDNGSDIVLTKRERDKDVQPGIQKIDDKHLYVRQFMKFVGEYKPLKSSKPISASQNNKVINESSTNYKAQATINDQANNIRIEEKIVPINGRNDEENENLVDIVDAIRLKLSKVEKTLLHALDQIDTIGKDVMKIVTSKQYTEQYSKSAAKVVKKMENESGNESTNWNQDICKSKYVKQDQQSNSNPSSPQPHSKSNTFCDRFPIRSANEFQKFNDELSTTIELKQFTMDMFEKTNVARVEIFLEENLKNLVSERVAKSMSWSGLNSEFSVKTSPVIALLRDAVVTKFNYQMNSPAVNLIRLYFGK